MQRGITKGVPAKVLKACCLAKVLKACCLAEGLGHAERKYKGVPAKVLKACCLAKGLGHAERNTKECQPRC